MKNINEVITKKTDNLPVKVLQFGQGNFIRAFADYFIDLANENGIFGGKVAIAKSTSRGSTDNFVNQDYLYTVALRGRAGNEVVDDYRVVSSIDNVYACSTQWNSLVDVARSEALSVIISNTTEAGICFDENDTIDNAGSGTYPAKLTALLFERFSTGITSKLLILPLELIEDNADSLKNCIMSYISLWKLGEAFENYVNSSCKFCNTLVDRIVTGFPKECNEIYSKLGYCDKLLVACEPYASWIIEGGEEERAMFPISCIEWVESVKPYRERKVKLLNGAHTSSIFAAYLCGIDIVRDMVNDADCRAFLNQTLDNEIMKTIDLPREQLTAFLDSVITRFDNPFIDHKLLDISLNSVAKFKARCLPSMLQYYNKFNAAPTHLCFSLATLIAFYNGELKDNKLVGSRQGNEYQICDNDSVLEFFAAADDENIVNAVLENAELWGESLKAYSEIAQAVEKYYALINTLGMREAMKKVINNE